MIRPTKERRIEINKFIQNHSEEIHALISENDKSKKRAFVEAIARKELRYKDTSWWLDIFTVIKYNFNKHEANKKRNNSKG